MDAKNLTEEQREALHQADVRLSLLYIFPDICEALIADIEEYHKKLHMSFKYEDKRLWNIFKKASYNLRSTMKTLPEDYRTSYAETCEYLQTLVMKAVDRCGDKDFALMQRFIDYISSFPSKRGIEFKYE